MYKKISVFFILSLFIISVGSVFGLKAKIGFAEPEINVTSKSAYLMDADSRTVIYKNNEQKRAPIASMCKIMTLLLSFEAMDAGELSIDETLTISENAAGMGGSQIFLETGGEYKVGELIKGITVASANDASVAIAERLAGSESSFVDKMNEKATALGMNDTVFVNCTGLPKAGQYSCAKDVAVMFSELIKHKAYFNYSGIWMDEISHPKGRITQISNTNKLIRFYSGCDAGKTGYTSEAGHCLAASAKRNGMRLISVIISAPDGKTRFKEASSLFNYGFDNFTNKLVVDCEKPLDLTVGVKKGKTDSVKVKTERSVYIFSEKSVKHAVELSFTPTCGAVAPIKEGDILGTLSVYDGGVEIDKVNVIAMESVNEINFLDGIVDVTQNWSIAQ